MKIGFVSLGCPKNRCDTEIMLHHLMAAGYEITPEETEADIIVINTCAFIESAKTEAIDNIIDIGWLKKHHTLKGIIVTGCLTERYREQIFTELPEVDAILGVGSIHNIVEAVKAVEKKEKYASFLPKESVKLGGDRILTTPEYTAYLKIAEGCDNRCSYCAIPDIRGPFRSREIKDIVKEAKGLEKLGIKELCLVAQDTTRYGLDIYGEYKLAELLRELIAETKIPWIRLLYCYPDKITDELIETMRDNKRIVNYIDMPIQHISDRMLTSMNRHGDSAMIRDVVKKLRENIPDIVIRTTAIVGFPGESEEDFNQLCDYIAEAKFERFGAFTYSREEDTPAYDFDDQIEEQTKQDRYDIIMREQMNISDAYNNAQIGKTVRVLVEDFDPVSEAHYGRSYADAPEIDGKVYFTAPRRILPGSFVDVKIEEVIDYDLFGKAIM